MADNRSSLIFVILIGAGLIFSLVISFIPSSQSIIALPFAVVAIIASVIGFAVKDYYYIFEPVLHSRGKSIVIEGGDLFYLSSNGNAIISRVDSQLYATSFVRVPIYNSSTEMTDDQKLNFSNLFSRAISISKTPVKISSQLYPINKDEYIARINTKLNQVEERYNTVLGNKDFPKAELDRVKGEVTMWHNLLDSVSKANSRALSLVVSASALGSTEDEAVNLAAIKADEIVAGINTTFGIPAAIISGEELFVCVEPDHMIPPTTVTEYMKFKSEETGR